MLNIKVITTAAIILIIAGVAVFLVTKPKKLENNRTRLPSQFRRQDSAPAERSEVPVVSSGTRTVASNSERTSGDNSSSEPEDPIFVDQPLYEDVTIPEPKTRSTDMPPMSGIDSHVNDTMNTIQDINRINKNNR